MKNVENRTTLLSLHGELVTRNVKSVPGQLPLHALDYSVHIIVFQLLHSKQYMKFPNKLQNLHWSV